MSATSAVPDFKGGLYDRLLVDAALAGVQVTYGLPFPKAFEKETIVLWRVRPASPTGVDAREGGERAGFIGRRSREERYVLEAIVSVIRPSRESQRTVTERAYDLVDVIRASIETWYTEQPSYGGTSVYDVQVTATELEEPANQETREAHVRVEVACKARLVS